MGTDTNDVLRTEGREAAMARYAGAQAAEKFLANDAGTLVPGSGLIERQGRSAVGSAVVLAIEEMLSDGTLKEMFVARHENDIRYVDGMKRWYRYDGKRWKRDEKKAHLNDAWTLCRDVAQRCLSDKELKHLAPKIDSVGTVRAVLELASADPRIAAEPDQWDQDPWLLNTPDGVVDLRTGKIRPHRPEDYLSKMTPVSPDWEMQTPVWLKFLDDIMLGKKELIAYLRRVLGYGLTGSTREHALFFGYGLGANGKSTLLTAVGRCMTEYAEVAPIETFTASKFDRHPTDIARMQGARLVTASETEEGRRWDESKVKQLTGGDKIAARFMRCDFFEFTPQFKLFIAGNHKPSLRTVDEAWRRRMHMIPFEAQIPPERRDLKLGEKLDAESPGILAWLIDGCLEWQRVGLAPPADVIAATDEYLEEEDSFESWFRECANRDFKAVEPSSKVYRSWEAWSKDNGEYPGTQKVFSKKLKAKGFEIKRESTGMVVLGIELKELEPNAF